MADDVLGRVNMKRYKNILKPIQLGNMELKNRIGFAPTYSFLASYDNHITWALIEWMRPLAAGGASLVVLGTGFINAEMPQGAHSVPWLGDDSCIIQMSQLFDTIHAYNCKAGIELVPIGKMSVEPFDERDKKGKPQVEVDPTELTLDEVLELIECYGLAAERVLKAGGDMVVVHGAHAQPPAAFFSKGLNHRHDEYGCDTFENRSRFAVEVLQSIRRRVGKQLAIDYRISGDDMDENAPTMEELLLFARLIEDKIDSLHVSKGQLAVHKLTPYVFPPLYFERGMNVVYAEQFKKVVRIPVSCVGGMDIDVAEKAISEGRIDMVNFSRPLLADPQIPNKVKYGKTDEIRPCVRCNTCIHRTHNFFLPVRCAINPTLGREMLLKGYPLPRSSKKVAVIGGGPAGMEAAKIAADRGHQVTLYEAINVLGGTLNLGSMPEFKKDVKKYVAWAVRATLNNQNITVKLATQASPEMIKEEKFDVVIIAIGSEPIIPEFAKNDRKKVVWVGDVESGLAQTGETVVIAGAGMTGMETAVLLARQGKKVTLIDMLNKSESGRGGSKMNIIALHNILEEEGVQMIDQTKMIGMTKAGIEVRHANGEKYELPCDTLVLSLGVRPRKDIAKTFVDCATDVILVGDCCTEQGTLLNATRTAFDAAMAIL
jgi:2,4-dienoyl-CoA reductase-like NADH-dependent reductase (Old Yellow Enzyme family)/thioredoxin reductase